MTLYHILNKMQSDKTDNRDVYMKDEEGRHTAYLFSHQLFCGDKIYINERTDEFTDLNDMVENSLEYSRLC